MHDAVEAVERECRELPLQFGHPHGIWLPLCPVALLSFSEKLPLQLVGAEPVFQVIALDLVAEIKVRQGREHPLQLRQEVFRVGWNRKCVGEGFRGDKGAWRLSLRC